MSYKEKGADGKETGIEITVKIPVNEDELSDFIFKVRIERENSISPMRLGKDLHIARALLNHFSITKTV